jgi:hypothetical protein
VAEDPWLWAGTTFVVKVPTASLVGRQGTADPARRFRGGESAPSAVRSAICPRGDEERMVDCLCVSVVRCSRRVMAGPSTVRKD